MSEPDNVEVPLDPEYITPKGMYVAGYIWGRHVRSPDNPPEGATPDFIKGIEDGYGSRLLEWEDKIPGYSEKQITKMQRKFPTASTTAKTRKTYR